MINLTKVEVAEHLNLLIWNYKVGDNIAFNFKQLFFLYNQRDKEALLHKKMLYNKYIAVTVVSIIEAVLYDFIVRLSEATTHFPACISSEKRSQIKKEIDESKQVFSSRERGEYKRVKNYSNKELRNLLLKYELLGQKTSPIYNDFEEAVFLRNRIHIFNWFGNFEPDEENVFTNQRVENVEHLAVTIITYLASTYSRPADSNQTDFWLDKINIYEGEELPF